MESTGEPLKIHISKECNAELTKLGGFVTGTYLKYYSKTKLFVVFHCFSLSFYLPEANTGESFLEELILASTNPQYDKRLFIEL
jgi:hypothetical protein